MSDFGKLNFAVAMNPTSAFPLDARTYFESLDEAKEAAKTAGPVGSTNTVYYYGMTLTVCENEVSSKWVIQPDNTLSAIAAGTGPSDGSVPVFCFLSQSEYNDLVETGKVDEDTYYWISGGDAK